jgi:hypothetical protein
MVNVEAITRLGKLVSEHPTLSQKHLETLVAALGFFFLPLGGGIGALSGTSSSSDPAGYFRYLGLLLLAISLVGLGAVAYTLRPIRWRVALHEKGFVFYRGGQAEIVPFGDVQEALESARFRDGKIEKSLRLRTQDGKSYHFDAYFQGVNDLCDAVSHGVTTAVLARAAEALDHGDEVEFGRIFLSPRGLRLRDDVVRVTGSREIKWDDIECIRVGAYRDFQNSGTSIEIRTPNAMTAWYWEKFTSLPNAEAFLELASRYTRVERE